MRKFLFEEQELLESIEESKWRPVKHMEAQIGKYGKGFPFPEWKWHKTSIRVGRLRDLLKTKEIAARAKDRLFLEKYKLLLKEK